MDETASSRANQEGRGAVEGVSLGDRIRITGEPSCPVLAVVVLYLDGDPEELHAGCRWHPKAQLVWRRVTELEAA